jgi:hypothetical protein
MLSDTEPVRLPTRFCMIVHALHGTRVLRYLAFASVFFPFMVLEIN